MTQPATEHSSGTLAATGPEGPDPSDSIAVAETPPLRSPAGAVVPAWLRFLALGSAAGVLSFGVVGLLLAVNGVYRPAVAFPIGAAGWVAVMVLARSAYAPRGRVAGRAHAYAAIGVVAILAITAWNGAHASQHVLINRDGGSYTNTARWLARDGSLSVNPRVGGFADARGLEFDSPAVYAMPSGDLQFQFLHLLPVVMAEGYALAGDRGLFHVPEVLGGIALLAFYVLAWRLLRKPFFALAATLTLAFALPQVWYARDSYSEIPSQILLFTALWLVAEARFLTRWRIALVSGLFLGALEAARIDAIVFLIGVPVMFAVAWLRAARDERRATAWSLAAFTGGVAATLLVGLVDATRHSGHYYSDLSKDVRKLVLATIASIVVCAFAVILWPRVRALIARLPRVPLAAVAGVLVTLAGFVAWIVRPRVQHMRNSVAVPLVEGLQRTEGLTVDPTRNYFEKSLTWMSWYLGPLTVAAAIVAAGFLVHALLTGRRLRTLAPVAVLVPGSLLYLYRASAVPDQVWVSRRYLVSAFPLLILLALGLAAALAAARPGRAQRVLQAGGILLALVAVGYPIYTIRDLGSMSEQRGYVNVIHQVCDATGPHAAVVLVGTPDTVAFVKDMPQPLRGWCGAEVAAVAGTPAAAQLQSLASAWSKDGRPLYAVAASATTLRELFPGAAVTTTSTVVNPDSLVGTLSRRPDMYVPRSFSAAVVRVPVR